MILVRFLQFGIPFAACTIVLILGYHRAEPVAEAEGVKPLARVARSLADAADRIATPEARYCRSLRGVPVSRHGCDFGPCGPCQPAHWPCSERTIICGDGGCDWRGMRKR